MKRSRVSRLVQSSTSFSRLELGIDFANEYRPWRDGQPLVYGDRFKP